MYILATSSPRRHELFNKINEKYKIIKPDIDENIPYNSAKDLVLKLSYLKANEIKDVNSDDIVIAADTVVVFDEQILGKAKSYDEAFFMLKKLSNNTHFVYTGVCIKKNKKIINFYEKTKIRFRKLSDDEIKEYIDTKKPFDKAGSYGIQETDFAIEIEGEYDNVVGLPVKRLKKELNKLRDPLLEIYDLYKYFDKELILNKLNLTVKKGEIFSIIGPSGVGKSTLAKIIIGNIKMDKGRILFDNKDLAYRKVTDIQMIFQDPYSSLNEKMTVRQILKEPLIVNKQKDIDKKVDKMLEILMLKDFENKYPANLSGGQRQRVVVGAAMILKPKLIICDEPLSALDLRTQEQILNLIKYFNKEYDISFIFISHDINIVKDISDTIFKL